MIGGWYQKVYSDASLMEIVEAVQRVPDSIHATDEERYKNVRKPWSRYL
jgi:hypothetical protein